MVNQSLREKIANAGYENSIVYDAPSFDNSIVGVDGGGKTVYAFPLMVEEYVSEEYDSYINNPNPEMKPFSFDDKREEAIEFIEYNTIRATPYMASHGITPRIIDYNPDTETYYDMISDEEFSLDDIDFQIDGMIEELKKYEC